MSGSITIRKNFNTRLAWRLKGGVNNVTAQKVQYRGNCQCCASDQAVLASGRMAKHGYQIKNGWFEGVCEGQDHRPMQIDRDVTDKVAAHIRKQAQEMLDLADCYAAGTKHPQTVHRAVVRPGQEKTIPWDDAREYERAQSLNVAIHTLRLRAKHGVEYANTLQSVATRVHGQPLKEVSVKAAAQPIVRGEQRLSESGTLLTCTSVIGARVYWKSERGTKSWTGSAAWRRLANPNERPDESPNDAPVSSTDLNRISQHQRVVAMPQFDELQHVCEALRQNDTRFSAGEITPLPHSRERESLLSKGLVLMGQICGIHLKEPLQIDANGEFSVVAKDPNSNLPGFAGQFGSEFAHWLSQINTRTGVSASKREVLPENGWCNINHFEVEKLLGLFENGHQDNHQNNVTQPVRPRP